MYVFYCDKVNMWWVLYTTKLILTLRGKSKFGLSHAHFANMVLLYDDTYVSSWAMLVITVIVWTQYQLCSAVSAGWRHAHIIDCIAIPISIHTLPILIFTGFWLVEAFGFQRSVYKHCRFYNYYVSALVCKSFCLEGTCLEFSCLQSVIWRLEDKSCAVLIVAYIYLPFSLA